MIYLKSLPRLMLACFILSGLSASAQVMPVNSRNAALAIPSVKEVVLHADSHLLPCTHVLETYHKGLITFDAALGKLLSEYGISSLDVTFSEVSQHLETTGVEVPQGCESNNQSETHLSRVMGSMGIFSLKEAFSLPLIQSALLKWNGDQELVLIEGGAAWSLLAKMPYSMMVDREVWTNFTHSTDLFWAGDMVCTQEINHNGSGQRAEASCLIPLDSNARPAFEIQQVQQQQQQRQQQQHQQQQPQQQQPQQQQTYLQQKQQEEQQRLQREQDRAFHEQRASHPSSKK